MREYFCFGSEAVNASGAAVRELVKSRVKFPPAQLNSWVLFRRSRIPRGPVNPAREYGVSARRRSPAHASRQPDFVL